MKECIKPEIIRGLRNDQLKYGNSDMVLFEDENGSGGLGAGHQERLADTLRETGGYIAACFNMGDNPLEYLRHYYPAFIWTFYKPKSEREFVDIVKSASYTWLAYPLLDPTAGIVAAYPKNGEPKRIYNSNNPNPRRFQSSSYAHLLLNKCCRCISND